MTEEARQPLISAGDVVLAYAPKGVLVTSKLHPDLQKHGGCIARALDYRGQSLHVILTAEVHDGVPQAMRLLLPGPAGTAAIKHDPPSCAEAWIPGIVLSEEDPRGSFDMTLLLPEGGTIVVSSQRSSLAGRIPFGAAATPGEVRAYLWEVN